MTQWEYAPAPESRDLANLKPSYRPFIGGEFVDGSGEPLRTINPATEEVLAEVGTASAADVDKAVKAARKVSAATSSHKARPNHVARDVASPAARPRGSHFGSAPR